MIGLIFANLRWADSSNSHRLLSTIHHFVARMRKKMGNATVDLVQAFHVMAKPTGARCNMRCDYCFFVKKRGLYPQGTFRMSDDIMERYIRQTVHGHKIPEVTIAWQGGEPTLMGIAFYQRALAIQKRLATPGMRIQNTLQTNGVLLDEQWCSFLAKNNFLVGLSIDGPKNLHDTFRKDRRGHSVFEKVVRAVRLMQKFGVEFNILCTVNAVNSNFPLDVYRYFRDELGAVYIQFIPIVETDTDTGEQKEIRMTGRTVDPVQYGRFLIDVFDEWVRRDVGIMFVQFFDGVLASYVRGYSTLCVLQPQCGLEVALEHNGDVYSCDHFVESAFLLGNIGKIAIDKLVSSQKQRLFGISKSVLLPNICKSCEFLFTCYGECPKNRIFNADDDSGKTNWLCTGLKTFFTHTHKHMQTMASLLRAGKDAADIMCIDI